MYLLSDFVIFGCICVRVHIFVNTVFGAGKKDKVQLVNCEIVISVKTLRSASVFQETNVTEEEVNEQL